MAITCPVDLDTLKLSAEIRSIYARVATDPSEAFHFHRGAAYAAEMLGYDATALASLPPATTASFAGVANPHRLAAIPFGATVVDIGCGAGMDLLLEARAVGPRGRAIGIDMTESMAARARAGARTSGIENVDVRLGDALSLPVESGSADVVISNGVLNLTPDKEVAFGEVFRVLKPGGQFLYGDIVVATELSESIRRNIDLWTG
ncbi:MAG: methyltransferase domain-containing protein [Hyphomicrobium sp.]